MATKLTEFIVSQEAFENKSIDFCSRLVQELRNSDRDKMRNAIGSVLFRELEILESLDAMSTAAADEWIHCADFKVGE
ncbi:MAG: hypothetical protein HUK20_00240 [Fibrobacter sp.]|nr:hypothetical protein [Fibrobacter sp.]